MSNNIITSGSSKIIAIIGSGEIALTISINAKKMGLVTHTFSNNIKDRVIGHSDMHHNISIFDVDAICAVCKNLKVDGVIATTELTIHIASVISYRLNLIGLPIGISNKIIDKFYVRNKASNIVGLHQPKYRIIKSNDEFTTNEFPIILKPTTLGGKRGVIVVDEKEKLSESLKYTKTFLKSDDDKILIEEYIIGDKEFSVESLSYKGEHHVIQITEKINSGPPHCVELGHIQPARISRQLRSKIIKVIVKLLEEVGIDNTATHTEIKLFKSKIYLIEINSRLGGDYISYPLTELSTGYPLVQGAIDIATGSFTNPDINKFNNFFTGIIFVTKQTARFKSLFDRCEDYKWLYKKNFVSHKLSEITKNSAYNTNYMIFHSKDSFPKEIKDLLIQK